MANNREIIYSFLKNEKYKKWIVDNYYEVAKTIYTLCQCDLNILKHPFGNNSDSEGVYPKKQRGGIAI